MIASQTYVRVYMIVYDPLNLFHWF